ncbi:MAG: tetratricopeptide repeat protein [Treponema sp.]
MRKQTIGIFFIFIFALPLCASPLTLFEQGKEMQYHENWYGAIELYQQALLENPSYNAAYYGLAECFYALGEYDQAMVYIEKARHYVQHNVEIENLYAFILIGLGRLEEALEIFTTILAEYPNNLDARFGKAEIEVVGGRLTSASELYKEALQRQGENRKALLSLALLSYETGNVKAASGYISRALQYHGDSAQVHYFASYLAALNGKYAEAESYVRTALAIQPAYDKAQALLSSILYASGRYREAIDLADQRIADSRSKVDAWYLKTLCFIRLNDNAAAFKAAQTGISVDPENELMRILLEELAIQQLDFEDSNRQQLSKYHSTRGHAFVTRNMTDQAVYEYRRALKIYPYNVDSRQAYSKILLRKGFPEKAIQQLEFIQSIEKSNAAINDTVEAYSKMLSHSIKNRWGIDPLYATTDHLSIGMFYQSQPANVFHPDVERLTAVLMTDIMAYNRRFALSPHLQQAVSFTEAFRAARDAKNDYFGIISVKENELDIQIVLDLYVGRTGSKAQTLVVYRSGNDRCNNALRRMTDMINQTMPVIGKIVNRSQGEAVIDIGASDCDLTKFNAYIIKKDTLTIANEGIGLIYKDKDVLGSFALSQTAEDFSEGLITRNGYYDRITKGDTIVLVTKEDKDVANTKEVPRTDAQYASQEIMALLTQLRSIR